MRDVEFLIVGAGAAGCTLAWLLRQAGREVLLLELRDAREKNKLCGGALAPWALSEIEVIFGEGSLDELGLAHTACIRGRCLDRELATGMSFASLPRKRLDDWLLARCESVGAEVRDRVRVKSVDERIHVVTCKDLRTGETMQIHYGTLVGADGASSVVRRLLTGRKQRVAVSIEANAPFMGEDMIMAYRWGWIGYCWYIPTGANANVGCMLYEGTVADCKKLLDDFCEGMGLALPSTGGEAVPAGGEGGATESASPGLRGEAVPADGADVKARVTLSGLRGEVVPAGDEVDATEPASPGLRGEAVPAGGADARARVTLSGLRGAPIPTGDDVLLRAGEGAWLVGDAAGLAWPTDGGGIVYALLSARLLASSLLGGVPYEEAMCFHIEELANAAATRNQEYFVKALHIAQSGTLWAYGGGEF